MTDSSKQPSIIGGTSHIAIPKRKWTTGKVILTLLVLGILGFGGYYGYVKYNSTKDAEIEIPTYKMKKDSLEISVTEEGTLASLKSHMIKAEFGGRCKIEWIIDEESAVKKGDVVIKFNTEDLQKSIDDYEVKLKDSEAALIRSKEDNVIALREDAASLLNAEKAIQTAEEELDKFLNSDVPRKKDEFKMGIRTARQSLREIEADVSALPFLIEKELKTLNDLEKAKIQLENKKSALRNKEDDYRIYLEYTLPRDLSRKREAIENAVRGFERTKNNIASKQAQRLSRIRSEERSLESTKTRLADNKKKVSQMEIVAPADGIVFYGSGEQRYGDDIKDALKPGQDIWVGQALMHIPDTSKMKVSVIILESDISKIQLGLPCSISVPSLDNATYTGTVSFKAKAARSIRYWDPTSTKVVSCEILVDEYDKRLTPGSTVKCKILVKRLEDVLTIPNEYVFEKDNHPIVYVKTGPNGQCEARRVKLGDNNSTYVVVEAGLQEGEEIFQYAPPSAENAEVTGEDYSTPPTVLETRSPEEVKKAAEEVAKENSNGNASGVEGRPRRGSRRR